MNARREFLVAAAKLVVLSPALACAQPRPARIGVLATIDRAQSNAYRQFVRRLAELGYIEAKSLALEYRSPTGAKDLHALARELLALRLNLIVAIGPVAPARALVDTRANVPVVLIAVDYDPVGSGIAGSYGRPGGNFTGVFIPQPALAAKRLELVRELLPNVKRVLLLSDAHSQDQARAAKEAARFARIEVEHVEVASASYDMEAALARGRKAGVQALLGLASPEFNVHRRQIAQLAVKHRLPAIGFIGTDAAAGFVASYGAETGPISARAAEIAVRILQGANPADLPIEQANVYELVVNLKTAKALGITIPQSVLFRADKVIE